MPYIGQVPTVGEDNSFKILDDLSSYTLTFDGSSASVVSTADDTITQNNHRFVTGQRVTYSDGGGGAIGGLSNGVYYIVKNDQNTIKLAPTYSDAINSTNLINFTSLGTGSSHTLNVAFDGVNTRFVATYDNGTKAQMTRAAQLQISMNGVLQQPQDTNTPTNGFGIDLDSIIVFSVAPLVTDVFWGNLVANNFPTFDISDNTVDSFPGDNLTTDFTLSKTPANNQNVLVTLDGVVQYPSDAFVSRAYSVTENVLSFTSAPGSGVAIQVRHIGFAGATSSNVTGFYGRVGNVALQDGDVLRGDGSLITNVQSSRWRLDNAGISTQSSIGINTTGVNTPGLTGIGNSFQGLYVSNGMILMDNTLNGDHYIGTAFNGLMAGPVNINGVLTIDGNYIVV
jgi:hypothetical protein